MCCDNIREHEFIFVIYLSIIQPFWVRSVLVLEIAKIICLVCTLYIPGFGPFTQENGRMGKT
jgi:hypothetical protein